MLRIQRGFSLMWISDVIVVVGLLAVALRYLVLLSTWRMKPRNQALKGVAGGFATAVLSLETAMEKKQAWRRCWNIQCWQLWWCWFWLTRSKNSSNVDTDFPRWLSMDPEQRNSGTAPQDISDQTCSQVDGKLAAKPTEWALLQMWQYNSNYRRVFSASKFWWYSLYLRSIRG